MKRFAISLAFLLSLTLETCQECPATVRYWAWFLVPSSQIVRMESAFTWTVWSTDSAWADPVWIAQNFSMNKAVRFTKHQDFQCSAGGYLPAGYIQIDSLHGVYAMQVWTDSTRMTILLGDTTFFMFGTPDTTNDSTATSLTVQNNIRQFWLRNGGSDNLADWTTWGAVRKGIFRIMNITQIIHP